MSAKKSAALGMRYSTANARLLRDLLFKFATGAGHVCFRCQKPLTRDTFSIDHKESWISAANPVEAFFNLDEIAFSHVACNSLGPVNRLRRYASPEERRAANAKINKEFWRSLPKEERQRRRRHQYEIHGT